MVVVKATSPCWVQSWDEKTTKEWKEKIKKMKRKKLQTVYMIQLRDEGSLFKYVNLSINKHLSLFKAVVRLGDLL